MRIQILIEPEIGDKIETRHMSVDVNGRRGMLIEIPYTQEKPTGMFLCVPVNRGDDEVNHIIEVRIT